MKILGKSPKNMTEEKFTGLRNFVGKQMLSFLRKGDFSHAGEIDSIELVMRANLRKIQANVFWMQDVGNGRFTKKFNRLLHTI